MSYRVTYAIDPRVRDAAARHADSLTLLTVLTRINEVHLRTRGPAPMPSTAGVRVVTPGPGSARDWRDIPSILRTGTASPSDMAAWRAAEHAVRHGVRPDLTWAPPLDAKTTLALDAFNGTQDAAASHADLAAMLDGLVDIDVRLLQSPIGARIPNILASGVRYEEEPPGLEFWQDIAACLQMGIGDCEDVCCWRVAELRVRHGIFARPMVIPQLQPSGSFLYHIVVLYPDGRIEDTSKLLGMV